MSNEKQTKETYWHHRLRLVDSNLDPYNDHPVIAACELPDGISNEVAGILSLWAYHSLFQIEETRRETGGAALLCGCSPHWDAVALKVKEEYAHLDAEHKSVNLSFEDRVQFYAKIQRDVFFPIFEEYANVRLNPDGSGVFLDGIDHEANKFGDELTEMEHHAPEYYKEGERRRCKLALDDEIKYASDGFFLMPDYESEFYYDGNFRYINHMEPMVIGSDEYEQLLDQMVEAVRTVSGRNLPVPRMDVDAPFGSYILYKSPFK